MAAVGGINPSDYTDIYGQTNPGGTISGLNENSSDDEMMSACKEFETYMVEQVYKSMQNTIMKADDEENEYTEYFGDMLSQKYSEMVTEQGKLGLAEQLYNSMKRNL